MLLAPVSIPYHSILSSIAVCVTNIMACRVYRNTREVLETIVHDSRVEVVSLPNISRGVAENVQAEESPKKPSAV